MFFNKESDDDGGCEYKAETTELEDDTVDDRGAPITRCVSMIHVS